jgi:hypothetical protein
MEVPPERIELIYQDIVLSVGYKTTVGPVDKNKVSRRYAGEKTELPSARLARAAWRAAAILHPLPPPITRVLVAPKTVNSEGGSDQRFCMRAPGVVQRADGFYTDESGAVYARDGDGLEESGVRNRDHIPGLVGAKSMDGKSACEFPPVGDPATNTGSWRV